jgi:pyruvate formate lyase activating enzyme
VNICGYLKTSLIEWPGKISSVVFVPGCNFRCPFCHNKDLVLYLGKLPSISQEEIFSDLKGRKKWIDGIAVTGGEPTLQSNLPGFLEEIKDLGFLTMVETNGTLPGVLDNLINKGLVDRVAMDVKGPLDGRYERISNVKCEMSNIESSIKLIVTSGVEYELRTTVVPTLLIKKDLVDLAKQFVAIIQTPSLSWFLQQFQPKNCLNPAFEKIRPYSQKYLEEILSTVKKYIPNAQLRGV